MSFEKGVVEVYAHQLANLNFRLPRMVRDRLPRRRRRQPGVRTIEVL